jgi:hypothetical protein
MYGEPRSTGPQPDHPEHQGAERRRFLGLELWQQIVAGLAVAAVVAGGGFVGHLLVSSPKRPMSAQGQSGTPNPLSITADPSKPPQEPIEFFNLNEDEKVSSLIWPLLVTGTVPPGEHAWVLVRSSGAYYIQGVLESESPDFWTLPSVSLGSATGPINAPYIISVVLANSQEDRAIRNDYSKTGDGNTGIAAIPDGAEVIRSITVIRTH